MLDNHGSSDRALVRAAAVDQGARERLRVELIPHVVQLVQDLTRRRGIAGTREDELVGIAMRPFERVFNVYLKNARNLDEEEGHFYKYYAWWARQEVIAYLKEQL